MRYARSCRCSSSIVLRSEGRCLKCGHEPHGLLPVGDPSSQGYRALDLVIEFHREKLRAQGYFETPGFYAEAASAGVEVRNVKRLPADSARMLAWIA